MRLAVRIHSPTPLRSSPTESHPKWCWEPASNVVDIGGTVTFQVRATDNVGIDTVALFINGTQVALRTENGLRVADVPFPAPGLFDVVATASDLAGNSSATDPWQVRVFDPQDNEHPVITVEALIPQVYDAIQGQLVDGDRIEGDSLRQSPMLTYLTDVQVSIVDDNMDQWRIEYAPVNAVDSGNLGADDPDYELLAEGTGVIDHERFRLDPTVLANDAYLLRVLAFDVNGQGWAEPITFGVSGNAKLGSFAFSVTDVSLSLSGIPIVVNRTYDTLHANTEGDFGYGWSMSFAEANIAETTPAYMEMQTGDRVYLTNPEGKRVGFTYEPELVVHGIIFVAGIEYLPKFTPDPGVTDQLTVKEGSYMRGGVFGSLIEALSDPWNPSQYVLTTREGTVYEYVQKDGLRKIVDTNDNTITFTDSAITHSSGARIDLVRDTRGRIREIIDPAGYFHLLQLWFLGRSGGIYQPAGRDDDVRVPRHSATLPGFDLRFRSGACVSGRIRHGRPSCQFHRRPGKCRSTRVRPSCL